MSAVFVSVRIAGRVLRARTPAGLTQEIYALLITYQLILAAGVIADTVITLTGAIGALVLANLMPDRRIRTSPRVVKRAISKYNAKGTVDRTIYKATVSIDFLAHPDP